jgi:large subunit ribosomal protein L12
MPQENLDTMEYVYAALLLHKLGKNVDEANLSSVVKASGAEVNEAQVKSLVAALADINIDDAVKAAPVAVAAAPAAGGGAKEEKKEEPKNEEAAMEGLSSLFG